MTEIENVCPKCKCDIKFERLIALQCSSTKKLMRKRRADDKRNNLMMPRPPVPVTVAAAIALKAREEALILSGYGRIKEFKWPVAIIEKKKNGPKRRKNSKHAVRKHP